jgi:CubicO group peptidase (beta-lactamase class C family)
VSIATQAAGALVAVAVTAWIGLKLRVYLAVGAGYKAKVLCTGVFGSGRAIAAALLAQVSDDSYRLLRPFRAEVDYDTRTVSASMLGLCRRTALHRDGLGATLTAGAPVRDLGPIANASPAVEPSWTSGRGAESLQRAVDRAFDEPNARRRRRTYAVVVVQDGAIVAERYAPGITADMPLPGWSMAKSVLNALVGVLVADGRLTLDNRGLLPEWHPPDPRAAITLDDLMRMRSGLKFSEAYANPWSDVLHMLYNCDDMAAYAASLPLVSPPGSVWSYSSGTTIILSSIVRRMVGDAEYHAWPRRVLFDPLGMRSAVLEPDASGTFVCSSYMLATARDWARYGQLWIERGRHRGRAILPEWWIDHSTTPTPQSPDGRFGAHWWLKLAPEIGGDSAAARAIASDAFFAVGHEGQTLTVIPSRRLVIVRLGAAIYIDAWNQAEFVAAIQGAVE